MTYFWEIDGVSIKIVKKRNVKNLILHCKENNIYLTTPFFCSKKKIESFLLKNIDKIKHPKPTTFPKITEFDKQRLFLILKDRIGFYSDVMNLPSFPFYIKDVKSYWGKCFFVKKYMIFNSALINFDISVIDCIVVHELAHFYHQNHGANFYKLVMSIYPNYKFYIKSLKKVSL